MESELSMFFRTCSCLSMVFRLRSLILLALSSDVTPFSDCSAILLAPSATPSCVALEAFMLSLYSFAVLERVAFTEPRFLRASRIPASEMLNLMFTGFSLMLFSMLSFTFLYCSSRFGEAFSPSSNHRLPNPSDMMFFILYLLLYLLK